MQMEHIYFLYISSIRPDIRMSDELHQRKTLELSRFLPYQSEEEGCCSESTIVLSNWLLLVYFLTFCMNSLCFKPLPYRSGCDFYAEFFADFSDCIRNICRWILIKICFQFIGNLLQMVDSFSPFAFDRLPPLPLFDTASESCLSSLSHVLFFRTILLTFPFLYSHNTRYLPVF